MFLVREILHSQTDLEQVIPDQVDRGQADPHVDLLQTDLHGQVDPHQADPVRLIQHRYSQVDPGQTETGQVQPRQVINLG